MADLAQYSKSELATKYESAKKAIARVRAGAKQATQRTTTVALSGVGGFAAGAIDEKMPEIGGLPTSMTVGVAMALLGITDAAGEASEQLLALGSGMVAGSAYGYGRDFSRNLKI